MPGPTDSISLASAPLTPPSDLSEVLAMMPELSIHSVAATADNTAAWDSTTLTSTVIDIPDNWTDGIEGTALQTSASDNSGILTIIVIMFVTLSLNFKECKKLFARFVDELCSNKKRENAFDEHSNHESRLTVLTVVQYLVYGGILLAGMAVNRNFDIVNSDYSFSTLIIAIAIFTSYYLFEICAYSVTGYTFGGKESSARLLRALNSSQSLAGLGLIFPALMTLFYPQATFAMTIVGGTVYVIARLIFISKGFSIFYNNIFSLVYFILYLCALEIIPVIYVYKVAVLLL